MLRKVQTVIYSSSWLQYVHISMICTTTDEWATVVTMVIATEIDPEIQAIDKVTINTAHIRNKTYRFVFTWAIVIVGPFSVEECKAKKVAPNDKEKSFV